MKTTYKVRNSETGYEYIDNAKSFKEAVEASECILNEPIEMVKITTEVINWYTKPEKQAQQNC